MITEFYKNDHAVQSVMADFSYMSEQERYLNRTHSAVYDSVCKRGDEVTINFNFNEKIYKLYIIKIE